ncbi:tricarballylate dehydrogenase [Amycolatopsis lurida]|uniref:Tricarballylate dehydrogenase n=1 Tax=Amycolatopsis lurida NRRL 2430 TaxID=1460371 RepID=A0A2P2FXA8_AMYLU|nr:FAD-dependent oxidoreductase [Amycolatopsis lurida]KFU81342.1 tricarballylate dehydrogenase [Amycolatopsis lurida NRRL 2430]SEE13732.1 tricarballylate dehydrogenase [Amycolatopsis lurida]
MDNGRNTVAERQVVVVGAGNAGLCAGIAALQAGAKAVSVLEAAPKQLRGGNSSLTRTMRFSWQGSPFIASLLREADNERVDEILAGRSGYTDEQYLRDWLAVSGDQVDVALIESIIRRSTDTITWMRDFGQRWAPRPTPLPGDVPIVLDGGGQSLQDRNFARFEQLGGTVFYGSAVTGFEKTAGDRYLLDGSGPAFPMVADALVLASAGFEANTRLRERHLGEEWRDVKLRGVPFNEGAPLTAAIDIGADTAGNWEKCHTTPQGINLPDHMLPGQMHKSHGLARYAFPLGVVVNREGRRFFDESGGYSNLTYVTLGQKIQEQPGKIAFQIFDDKVFSAGSLPKGYVGDPASVSVSSLEEGARRLGIDAANLTAEVQRLHAGQAEKRLDTPPFLFVPVVCGLTFTYGGLSVTPDAEVRGGGEPISGLYAAGVIVGGLYDQGYPGGTGLMAGAVLGRAAGTSAARHAIRSRGGEARVGTSAG